MKSKYHIDTTPEEDSLFRDKEYIRELNEPPKNAFLKTFGVVLSLHALIGVVVSLPVLSTWAFDKTNAKDKPSEQTVSGNQTKPIEGLTNKNKTETIQNPSYNKYVIKKGDTINSISRNHKIKPDILLKINPNIKNPNFIRVNQTILIP